MGTCGFGRIKEIDAEIRSANEAGLAGQYDHTRDTEYRSANDQRGVRQPVGQFNPLGTYTYGMGNHQDTNQNQRSESAMPEDIFATPEYRTAFYKTLLGKDLTDVETETYSRAMNLAKVERRDAFSTTTSAAAVHYLINELTISIMQGIAYSLINGQGTTEGTGIVPGITWDASNSFTYIKGGSATFLDFTKMMSMLKRGYGAGASWCMNNKMLYSQIYSMLDAVGRPIFMNDPKVEGIGYILGLPVIVDDNLPDGTAILGNFQYLGYNIPLGIMIEVSRESSFKSALVDYRGICVCDTKVLVAEAFIMLSESLV